MVRFLLGLPGIRSLYKRQLLFPIVVLLIVFIVLVDGAIDRVDQEARDAASAGVTGLALQPAPSPPRPILRGLLEKTPLTYFSDYWAQLAETVGPNLVGIGRTQVSGVVVEAGLAVTTLEAAEILEAERARGVLAQEAGTLAEALVSEERVSYPFVRLVDREFGLAVVEIEPTHEPFTVGNVSQMPSGSYVGVVFLENDGRPVIAPGYLVSSQVGSKLDPNENDLQTSLLPSDRGVSAVVDLDGALVGVMYRSPHGPRSLTLASLRRVIDLMAEDVPCRAITVSSIDDEVLAFLDVDSGLLVTDVIEEAFVPEPSVRSGDVLLEWGGEPVLTVESFIERYDSAGVGALVRYRVLRGQRRVDGGTVLPDTECRTDRPATVRLGSLGIILRWSDGASAPAGWTVETIAEGGYADVAGIQEGDVVSAINGVSLDDVNQQSIIERISLDDGPKIVALRRDGQSRLAVMTDR